MKEWLFSDCVYHVVIHRVTGYSYWVHKLVPYTSVLVSFFLSSPNLSGRRLDVCHTSTYGVALVRI